MPFQSVPYAPRTMYEPRYNDSIAQLMARQGEIAGQAQMQKAAIWGNAMNNLGQIGAQAYQQHAEQKQAKNREMALNEVLGGWDGQDPQKLFMGLASVIGPEPAIKVAQGIVAVRASKPNQPDPKLFGAKVGALKALKDKMGPEWLPNNWGSIGPMVAEDARAFLGVDLNGEYRPEYAQALDALAEQMAPAQEGAGPKVIPAGGVLADSTGKELYKNPAAAAGRMGNPEPVTINGKPTMATPEEIAQAKQAGATVTPYQAPSQAQPREPKMYEVEVPGPDGTLIKKVVSEAEMRAGVTVAPKSVGNKPVTGAERQALSFYNRAKEASEGIEELEDRITDRNVVSQAWNTSDWMPNIAKSDDQQLYEQHQRTFTEARLRKESGAAIPPAEFESDRKTYWVQPGDSDETKKRKRVARAKLLEGLAYSAGKAYDEFYGEPAPRSGAAPAAGPKDEPPKGVDPAVAERLKKYGKPGGGR
jgi:hypothetical protein